MGQGVALPCLVLAPVASTGVAMQKILEGAYQVQHG
ncbi:hypothetical protein GGR34_003644 [Microvirga flocculans]|uniref:Uncharacterized protein n=1 Tax=Microvirga flocculans TaxID=217168 RepID=A0A7W6II74_9HYPH|nr:hypothetical protein [Microvirga flocculans]